MFPNSTSFDGQFYHYIAHDPFLRTDLKDYIDDPRMRYHRILIPLLAYVLAWGRSPLIDPACEVVCLLSVALGVYWSCRFAQRSGLAAAWGLLFLAMPAIPITPDRLVVDGGLAALTRDTGLLLVLAYCVYLVCRREFRGASVFVLSAAPTLTWFGYVWFGYVQAHTTGNSYRPSLLPLVSIVRAVAHPSRYPAATPLVPAVIAADYLALAGALLAFVLAHVWFARGPCVPLRIAAALFAALGLLFQIAGQWDNVFTFGRIYAPLLVCLSGTAAVTRNPWLLLPAELMLPRIAIQFAPQVLGVIHASL